MKSPRKKPDEVPIPLDEVPIPIVVAFNASLKEKKPMVKKKPQRKGSKPKE
jgi:hypothetical protein